MNPQQDGNDLRQITIRSRHGVRQIPARTHEANFVAAHPQRPLMQPPAIDQIDISPVWSPTASRARDSISAVDRAKAHNLRMVPVYALIFAVALLAVVAYSLLIYFLDQPGAPWALDRILIFLAVLSSLGLVAHINGSRTDYQHTHAGVERHRITTAAEVYIAQIEATAEVQREALRANLALLSADEHD